MLTGPPRSPRVANEKIAALEQQLEQARRDMNEAQQKALRAEQSAREAWAFVKAMRYRPAAIEICEG